VSKQLSIVQEEEQQASKNESLEASG